jgi:hypothetical protein
LFVQRLNFYLFSAIFGPHLIGRIGERYRGALFTRRIALALLGVAKLDANVSKFCVGPHKECGRAAIKCDLLTARPSVGRIWRAFGLQPHRVETFKLSTDPLFVDKVRDIVGLYLNPPDRAMVLCVDEKSQIQALDRTQPLLPMRPGQIERRSHDYQRHGTTSLFAALDIATGQVIGRCYQRHRAVEFRKFLATVEEAVPAELDIHLVLENYATHKAPPVKTWLARHPRYHLHYTPTSASWLNQVHRWFALLADKQIKRGVHRSVHELKAAITAFIQAHNDDPKPFVWTKIAEDILQTIARYCSQTLEIHATTYSTNL